MSTLCDPMDCTVHGILQARILEWGAFPFSRGSSQPKSPTVHMDSLPADPQGKSRNTGVGSLSLLQRIFPTQESNRALLHCRWILYQLSYEGSPISMVFYCLLSHIERVTGRKARGLQKLPAKLKLSSLESVSVPRHTLYLFK